MSAVSNYVYSTLYSPSTRALPLRNPGHAHTCSGPGRSLLQPALLWNGRNRNAIILKVLDTQRLCVFKNEDIFTNEVVPFSSIDLSSNKYFLHLFLTKIIFFLHYARGWCALMEKPPLRPCEHYFKNFQENALKVWFYTRHFGNHRCTKFTIIDVRHNPLFL